MYYLNLYSQHLTQCQLHEIYVCENKGGKAEGGKEVKKERGRERGEKERIKRTVVLKKTFLRKNIQAMKDSYFDGIYLPSDFTGSQVPRSLLPCGAHTLNTVRADQNLKAHR